MSLLWRDELRVVMAPEKLVLVRLVWTLTRRGLIPHVVLKTVADCLPADDDLNLWDAAIRTLDAELPKLSGRKMSSKVILSNHFLRYTLVPWSESLSDAAEEEAYARHCFKTQYGTDAGQWELRLSAERPYLPQLASAVDTHLLEALRGVFKRNGVVLKSLQPRLMAAYNNCRHILKDSSAWFALYEPGCLCLALLQHGRWASVRTMRAGSGWCDALLLQLEREAYLTEADDSTQTLFLWAPELDAEALPVSREWQINNLHPLLNPALAADYEGRFGMALSG